MGRTDTDVGVPGSLEARVSLSFPLDVVLLPSLPPSLSWCLLPSRSTAFPVESTGTGTSLRSVGEREVESGWEGVDTQGRNRLGGRVGVEWVVGEERCRGVLHPLFWAGDPGGSNTGE